MSSSPYTVDHELAIVGNPNVNRRTTMGRVTGQTVFSSDILPKHINAPSFVYMAYVTCPYPRAKIVSIDVSRAEAAGYVTVTPNELPPYDLYNAGRPYSPLGNRGTTLSAGQPVVAVGAPSPDGVEDAKSLVSVKFEPLPYVMDAEEALQPGAPQIWQNGNSPSAGVGEGGVPVPSTLHIEYGDVDTAFNQADAIVETTLETQPQQHFDLEPVGVVANWVGGTLYIYDKDTYAASTAKALANYFGIPATSVIVRSALGGYEGGSALGSAFGNGSSDNLVIASLMSKKAAAPVKFVATRFNNSLYTTYRFPIRGYVKFGGTKDGRFTAMQADLYVNVGGTGGSSGSDAVSDFYNAYAVPNVRLDSVPVNTNIFYKAAYMRDVGESQGHFIMESAVDMLAEKLGIDPLTFRLNNMRAGATAVDPVSKLPYSGFGQPAVTLKARDAFGWSSKWQGWASPSSVSGTLRRGVGIAILNAAKGSPFVFTSGQIQIDPDGTVTVFTGHTDQGAGTSTAIPIMAAEALGLTSMDNVKLVASDTSLTTDTGITNGSVSTRNAGPSYILAAHDLARQWFPIVAKKLNADPNNLTFGGGMVYDKTNAANGMTFKGAAALLQSSIKGYGGLFFPNKVAFRVGGMKFVEVEVDTETADARVVNYVGGIDIGKVVFAKGAQSQARGGFIGLGIGQAFYEELLNDPSADFQYSGSYLNPNFLDLKVPTIMETPDSAEGVWEEYVDPIGPYGAKGIGENVLIGASAAIANAMSNALGGYRFTSLPIRKEDIVAAIRWMKSTGKL
ncbi:MAG: xanthine dehydrogenase family protein molybdopterin-binding subunit [Nitrososphaerota archaeon]|nr:xanthine dehydrogenase family protein molybdopterin-binding subunit [Nitrososphaerota archaeon]